MGQIIVAAFNFTPVPRTAYRVGLPASGAWHEAFNSDSSFYNGSNLGNVGGISAEAVPWMGYGHSAQLTLPPLGAVFLIQGAG